MSIIQHHHNYTIGSLLPLSDTQMGMVISQLELPLDTTKGILGGRHQPRYFDLDDCGPVVMKKYFRGGFIRRFIRETHLKWGPTRPHAEFNMLNRVRTLGINAPNPVTFIVKGKWLYQGWLVTQQIENACALAELAIDDPKKAEKAVEQLIDQISLLVKHRIHHTDLHPGNVLVDDHDKVYIVDFDKARIDNRNLIKLRTRYQKRWHRAISKYRLPKWLDTVIDEPF